MRLGRLLVCTACALSGLWAPCLASAETTGPAPPQPIARAIGPVPWLIQESWPDGQQHDSRLDKTVTIWGAGISLAQVFNLVREQTGVTIVCWPAGDDNERICVNVFLNPKSTPSLRDLMATISWVTGCAFGFSDESGERIYYLLRTSIKSGAMARRQASQAEMVFSSRQEWQAREAVRVAEMPVRWGQYKAALSLSREQLVGRYKDRDNDLLLALLDPRKRALVEFLAQLPEGDLAELLRGGRIVRDWSQWSPEQRGDLQRLLDPQPLAWSHSGYSPPADMAPSQWQDDAAVSIVIGGASGSIVASARKPVLNGASPFGGDYPKAFFAQTGIRLVPDDQPWLPEETMALRQALGQPDIPWTELSDEFEAKQTARIDQIRGQFWREKLRQQCRLSEEVKATLSQHTLPLDPAGSYSLWQVQEAVAVVSDISVVSDAFWQPERSPADAMHVLCPREPGKADALTVLCVMCGAREEEYVEGRHEPSVAWELEGTSSLLRFRSLARDVWRAAFLPADTLGDLDRALEPYLVQAEQGGFSEHTAKLTLDLPVMSRIASRLDSFQVRYGGSILYGDPADPKEGCRRDLREAALEPLAAGDWVLPWLGALTDQQWARVWKEGLNWAHDLTPTQLTSPTITRLILRRVPQDKLEKLVVKLSVEESADAALGSISDYKITFYLDGEPLFRGGLGRTVLVQISAQKHLVTLAGVDRR